MSIAHDDPRLTAYALGELDPEAMQTFRAELAEDARARAEVLALRELGARLERDLQSEPAQQLSTARLSRARLSTARLSTARRERILAAAEQRGTATGPKPDLLAVDPGGPLAALPGNVAPQPRPLVKTAPRLRWRRVGVLMAALVSTLGASVWLLRGKEPEEQPLVASSATDASAQEFGQTGTLRSPGLGVRESMEFGRGNALNDDEVRDGRGSNALRAPIRMAEPPAQPALQNRAELDSDAYEATPSARGGRESYDTVGENPFLRVTTQPHSTFSIDVDTASYALVRRFLTSGSLPPRGAVRIEELINYFDYSYPEPSGDEPFSLVANLAPAPWAPEHRLVRIGLQARHLAQSARPPANLVFLIDVSGSMSAANKLELVKYGLRRLTESLGERDRVSIVVYAGASGLVLPPTAGNHKSEIRQALAQLEAGGSTNGGQGIELAYSLAAENFIRGGVNRVLLATDGDFNVGVTNESELVELIQRKAKTGVFLSVLGFGAGNYQDSMLEKLADKGNGNYAYVDQPAEAEKVLVEQASGTLVTVAKDVKLQVEFNPLQVATYRLIGYENRLLAHEDFNDDSKDAGEVGAGHSVTALYEITLASGEAPTRKIDRLLSRPYIVNGRPVTIAGQARGELLTIKLRYQPPEGGASRLQKLAVRGPVGAMNEDFRFAAALAEFGMLLRESPHRGQANFDQVLQLAESSLGDGKDRQARMQFVELVRAARRLGAGAESKGKRPFPGTIDQMHDYLP